MNKLKDRVAIVTGAGQGIGAAIARELSTEGAIIAPVTPVRTRPDSITRRRSHCPSSAME